MKKGDNKKPLCEGWKIKLLGQDINLERLYFHSKGKRASVGKS